MAEKEIPADNAEEMNVENQNPRPDLSADRQSARSMFASADAIIRNLRTSDSLKFIRQSKQSGGQ